MVYSWVPRVFVLEYAWNISLYARHKCLRNRFLKKAWDLNPELTVIERLISLYDLQNGKGFSTLIDMEGGFSLSPEVIKDKERMKPICDEIVAVCNYCDDILEVFKTI